MGDDGERDEPVSGELVEPSGITGSALGHRNLRPWRPGESGNPGGRPKAERDVVELARRCTPEVIKRLLYIAMRGNIRDGATVRACELLLERGWGKAPLKLVDENGNATGGVFVIAMPAERSNDDGE